MPTIRILMPDANRGSPRPSRRTDPDRRDRIIDCALDVIATEGVAGASHRNIAAAADVPLGSMTYHFSGMKELLYEAFSRFLERINTRIADRHAGAHDRESAIHAVVETIELDIFGSTRDVVLTHELYTLAARESAYQMLTSSWMSRTRDILELHFDPVTARILDATVEGLTIHRALDTSPQPPDLVRDAIQRIADGARE